MSERNTVPPGANPRFASDQPAPTGAAGQPPAGAEVDQVAGLEARVAELEDRWRRVLANLDNLRKRRVRESAQQRAEERARVALAWLPVLDNLEFALEHADADPKSIIAGVRAVREQPLAVLDGLGFPRLDDAGAAFDPARHEAVAALPGVDAPAGTVIRVVRPGYGEGERQLRPAAVVVAAGGGRDARGGRDPGEADRSDAEG
jgi:molecular chaperone GrpE